MSEIRANSITDAAGTGAPNFPNGLQIGGTPLVSGTQNFTASGSIAEGNFVGLNSNGTVSRVGTTLNPLDRSFQYLVTQRTIATTNTFTIYSSPNAASGRGALSLSDTTTVGAYWVSSGSIVARVTTFAANGSATFGPDYTAVASGVTSYDAVVKVSADSFAIFYRTATTNNWVIIGQVSGTAITFVYPTLFQNGFNKTINDSISNENGTIVIAGNTTQTNAPLRVAAISVSGTTATAGAFTVLRSAAPSYQQACLAHDPVNNVFLLNTVQITTPWTVWSWAMTVSGTTISFGSQQNVFGNQYTFYAKSTVIYDPSISRFTAITPGITSTALRVYTATVSSLVITASAQTTDYPLNTNYFMMLGAPDGTILTGNETVTAWGRLTYDPLNSFKPTVTRLPFTLPFANFAGVTLIGNSGLYVYQDTATNTLGFVDQRVTTYGFSTIANAIGAANQTATNGQPATVAVSGGVATGFSGLTTGAVYYVSPGGVPSLSGTVKFGNATSASSILIGPAFV
jgi:hypothetical protein